MTAPPTITPIETRYRGYRNPFPAGTPQIVKGLGGASLSITIGVMGALLVRSRSRD